MNRLRHLLLLVLSCLFFACTPAPATPLKVLGHWHTVAAGETIASVASKYSVDPQMLAQLNDLSETGTITGRTEIFIPLNAGLPPGTGEKKSPAASGSPTAATTAPTAAVTSSCGIEDRKCYQWPAKGTISTRFETVGETHHDGLDIAGVEGADIVAADDGIVLYSGDAIKGYGNLILIKHADGNITVYAHNRANLVKEQEKVSAGMKIAEMGRSGAASAVHLHFEVRRGETPVDPMRYLPEIGETP